jgi:hypothetical protein
LNLVAAEHEPIRTASVDLVTASPDRIMEVVSRCVDDLPLFPFEETAAPPVPTPTLRRNTEAPRDRGKKKGRRPFAGPNPLNPLNPRNPRTY